MINIENEVLEFIHRRFPVDCKWMDGNCFYFSKILLSRFPEGTIWYEIIDAHFVFKYKGHFYDWTGETNPQGMLVEWDKFEEYDRIQKQVVIRDCIM